MKADIEKAKIYTSVILINDSAFPGDVADIKHSAGPTSSINLTIKRCTACKSIIYENNDVECNATKKSLKVILSANKGALTPSIFKLEFKTEHLSGARKALLFYTMSFLDKNLVPV